MNWDALRAAGCAVRLNAPLADYTTFRLGGPCPALVACATLEQLTLAVGALHAAQQDFVLIGGGSNLLVSDQGLTHVVVRYVSDQPHIRREGNIVSVSGSTLLDDLIAWTVEEGLDGLVYASGIPGTVGGAVAGNAGAFGRQIGDVIETAVILDPAGQTQIVPAGELGFAYRRSRLQATGEIVAAVRLHLPPGDRAALRHQRAEFLDIRRHKHPDWRVLPTAGSFFKNVAPTSAAGRRQAAGWFLEQAGAQALRVRGARPFEKHANIVVRDGECAAQDVLNLARQMAAAVQRKFGLALEREVRLLGHFE